jgi:RND superfamily putative drug exporter
MVVVLASMGFTATSLFVMTIGVGLALSVVIDATVVRSIIVPAAMQLLGRANWWPGRPRPAAPQPDPSQAATASLRHVSDHRPWTQSSWR